MMPLTIVLTILAAAYFVVCCVLAGILLVSHFRTQPHTQGSLKDLAADLLSDRDEP